MLYKDFVHSSYGGWNRLICPCVNGYRDAMINCCYKPVLMHQYCIDGQPQYLTFLGSCFRRCMYSYTQEHTFLT